MQEIFIFWFLLVLELRNDPEGSATSLSRINFKGLKLGQIDPSWAGLIVIRHINSSLNYEYLAHRLVFMKVFRRI